MQTTGSAGTAAVVGIGEVGLRLSVAFTEAGYQVVGVDLDEDRIEKLNDGESYIRDISDEEISELTDNGFVPTTEYEAVTDAEFVSICVPTPLQKTGQPDVSYVVDALERLSELALSECTIIVESTVYPGATANLFRTILEDAGWTVGEDIYLGFSPERVDPGNDRYGTTDVPKVFGGVTPSSADRIQAAYERVFRHVVRVDNSTEAEMTKILENTFRNVNIALVNELVKVADGLDIDFWSVIDAAETKPYGFMPFYPGPGLGGHCIPVDPVYLSWRAKQSGLDTPLIDLADETNRDMSEYVVRRVSRLLNDDGIALSDSEILVLGAAYKPDVPDVRNSPAVDIIELLEERNVSTSFADPYISQLDVAGTTHKAVELSPETVRSADCVLIVTDHSSFDLDTIVDAAPRIFDTRNATAEFDSPSIERL